MQQISNKGAIQLAIGALKLKKTHSGRRAAATYTVARSTIQRRRAGIESRRDCQPNSKKLDKL